MTDIKYSEFVCSVCGRKELRDLDKEWDNIALDWRPITFTSTGIPQGGLIWTCSPECRVTYMLQKTI